MLGFILLLFSGAVIAPMLSRKLKHHAGLILSLFPLLFFVIYILKTNQVSSGNFTETYEGFGHFTDLSIGFLLDGLSLLFVLLITGIGFLILIYSHGYMREHENIGRFYALMMFFMASMAGLVLSGNLISIYIFWELTSISSFLLIGYHYRKPQSRDAASQALLVTSFGGLAMLAGFIMIGNIAGTYSITELSQNRQLISDHQNYLPALILILLGVVTKSAQFPFHFWLPSAMVAPTPVSAYLHSAAMVNAGIFLLARIHPFMGNTELWSNIVTFIGALTMLVGAYYSVTQKDLKRILAYTTVSALGLLTLLLGIGTILAVKAALLYLVVHAFYKASLFMIAGTIDEKAGSRNIYLLGNLKKRMPLTTLIAMLVLLSMAGLPPMLGYVSKEMIYEAKVQTGISTYVLVFGVASNIFMLLISMIIAYNVFLRSKSKYEEKPKEAGLTFMLGPAILSVLSFVLVMFSGSFGDLIEYAVETTKVKDVEVHLKLWKGLTPAFWLSLITIGGGILLFIFRSYVLSLFRKMNKFLFYLELSYIFSRLIDALLKFAKKQTSYIQHGYHRFYLMIVFILSSVGLWFYLVRYWDKDLLESFVSYSIPVSGIVLISVIASVVTILTRSKLTAIVTMGVIGYGIALIFLIYGAIDLAITQFLVDTLVMVLFVIAVYKLPEFGVFSSRITRFRDILIALSVGGFMAGLSFAASQMNLSRPMSDFYLKNSLPEGLGKNVVNVILTDFRALDTLGEITVLSIAAISVFALLKLEKKKTHTREITKTNPDE